MEPKLIIAVIAFALVLNGVLDNDSYSADFKIQF